MRLRRSWFCVVVAALMGCEEGPDQIFKPLPEGLDRTILNGLLPQGYTAEGNQPFEFKSSGKQEGTAKICEGDEQKERWSKMIKEPIIPTIGAGGLDLRGKPMWSGMTIDQAQQELCQISLLDTDVGCWGDNCELVVYFDSKTREIDQLLAIPGYEGKVTAGDYVLATNQNILFQGKKLSNPLSDASLRALNIALLKAFRPEMGSPESRDCIAANSCSAEVYKTHKTLRLLDLSAILILEPEAERILYIGVGLKRAFAFASADVTFDTGGVAAGLPPMPKVPFSASCAPTLGSPWSQIATSCMGQDDPAKAKVQADSSGELAFVDMDGLGLYLSRPSLKADAILPDDVKPAPTDAIASLVFSTAYEGALKIPQGTILARYVAALVPEVTKLVPALAGAPEEQLDAALAKVKPFGDAGRIKLGTQRIEECDAAGTCQQNTLVARTRQIVLDAVQAAGAPIPDAIKDPNFFVRTYIAALMATFNDDKLPTAAELYFYPFDDTAERLYAVFARELNGQRYIVRTGYVHPTDNLFYLLFKQGPMRTEAALWKDAGLQQYDGSAGDGKFRLWNLARSPRIGLATQIKKTQEFPDLRKATISIKLGALAEDVLVSYSEQNSLAGFGIPTEGQRDIFVPAASYGFTGNVINAHIWATDNIVRAVYSSAFFDKLDFCGVEVGLWDEADAFLKKLPADCDKIVTLSENGKVISAISAYVASEPYKIGLRLYVTANRIDSAYYWGEPQ